MTPVFETALKGLDLIHRGKVRDVYALDGEHMLIVTTDRLSAFDVVMPNPIPEKGRVLTQISNFWFEKTGHIVRNHLTGRSVEEFVTDPTEREMPAKQWTRTPCCRSRAPSVKERRRRFVCN